MNYFSWANWWTSLIFSMLIWPIWSLDSKINLTNGINLFFACWYNFLKINLKVAGVGSSIRNPSDKLPTIDRIILLKLIHRVAVEKMFSKNHNPIQKLIEIVRWKFIFADSEMKVNTNKSLIIIILIFNTGLILVAIQELSLFLLCENHLHSTTCRVFLTIVQSM